MGSCCMVVGCWEGQRWEGRLKRGSSWVVGGAKSGVLAKALQRSFFFL